MMTNWDITKLQHKEISPMDIIHVFQNSQTADQMRHILRNSHGMEITKAEADSLFASLELKFKPE